MRGKEVGVSGDGLQLGITPAYAGKSSPGLSDMHANGDHPRMCGEKARTLIVEDEPQGSPPHVRGKAPQGSGSSRARGITPACAGKSAILCFSLLPLRDHPRMCGEKYMGVPTKVEKPGSPPHVRGKGAPTAFATVPTGITPACAGKRHNRSYQQGLERDHPRMCGEKPKKIP